KGKQDSALNSKAQIILQDAGHKPPEGLITLDLKDFVQLTGRTQAVVIPLSTLIEKAVQAKVNFDWSKLSSFWFITNGVEETSLTDVQIVRFTQQKYDLGVNGHNLDNADWDTDASMANNRNYLGLAPSAVTFY